MRAAMNVAAMKCHWHQSNNVTTCRDKWLVPGGLIFPDKATLSIAGIEAAEYKRDKIESWWAYRV